MNPIEAFIEAAVVSRVDHSGKDITRAEAIRAEHADVIGKDIFTAAILGDEKTIAALLAKDTSAATKAGAPYDWDPLTCLAFSKYLRADDRDKRGFAACARLLLDHGANASTGFYWKEHSPEPTFESAIYGAAGVAQHLELTRLLLERGANPNDDETAYHVAEGWQNDVVLLLLKSGKLNDVSLTTVLHRKLDWHDLEGARLALTHGADPNRVSLWKKVALEQSLSRDNAMPMIELLLEHGADPTKRQVLEAAARSGRGDALRAFRAFKVDEKALAALDEAHHLLAACALDDAALIAKKRGAFVDVPKHHAAAVLCHFAGTGNTEGVGHLLDLGVDVNAIWEEGFGYMEVPKQSTALHVAAWRARHETLKLLLDRGATVDTRDGRGRTALTLAARACTSSYWTDRRQPDSVAMLLKAGADPKLVDPNDAPLGYEPVDQLLGRR